jgi:hypothetical protein
VISTGGNRRRSATEGLGKRRRYAYSVVAFPGRLAKKVR